MIRLKDLRQIRNELDVLNRFLLNVFVMGLLSGLLMMPVWAYSYEGTGVAQSSSPKWRSKKIQISISSVFPDSSKGSIGRSELENAVRECFENWARESDIEITFRSVSSSSISGKNSGGDGISLITIAPTPENLLVFTDKDSRKSAITRLFFDSDGFIKEADIVLNPTFRFTNDGSRGSFDLKSTIAHEAGHFLGLGHSEIVSATMHKHQTANGTFALPATYARTLSEDDKAGIRALYGSPKGTENEFGSIDGRIKNLNLDSAYIWVENASSGKVVAGTRTDAEGRYFIQSVPFGGYRLYSDHGETELLSDSSILIVERGETTVADIMITGAEEKVDNLGRFGFNGQLSDLAVPVESGHTYTFVFGVKGVNPKSIRIKGNAAGIHVDSSSLNYLYSNGDVSVISFEVSIDANATNGDYSLAVFDDTKLILQVPGVVTIDEVTNPWYSSIF